METSILPDELEDVAMRFILPATGNKYDDLGTREQGKAVMNKMVTTWNNTHKEVLSTAHASLDLAMAEVDKEIAARKQQIASIDTADQVFRDDVDEHGVNKTIHNPIAMANIENALTISILDGLTKTLAPHNKNGYTRDALSAMLNDRKDTNKDAMIAALMSMFETRMEKDLQDEIEFVRKADENVDVEEIFKEVKDNVNIKKRSRDGAQT